MEQGMNYGSLLRAARFKRLWRLARIAKLFRFIKIFKNDQRKNIHLALRLSIQLERLIYFLLLIAFLIHLIACVWLFIGNIDEYTENWITTFGFEDLSNVNQYIVAIYWSVTTLVTVGYGDIYPTNTVERIYCFVIMITGIMTYSYTISSISNIIASLDSRKALLTKKLNTLNMISRTHKLSHSFYTKLCYALEYEHRNHDKELESILMELPVGIKHELLQIIYEEKVCKNSFFKGKSLAFVAWVAPKLRPVLIHQNEFVYKENEFANEMYFILKGKLSFNLKRMGMLYPFVFIEENYYFGEIDLLFSNNKNHMNTVKAEKNSELLTLNREDFEEMLSFFEDEAIEICINARKRLNRINSKMMEAATLIDERFAVKPITSIPAGKNIDLDEVKSNARKSVNGSVIKCTSLYKDITEEKNPENFIKVIKLKIKKINLYSENIEGLSSELLELVYANKQKG
jgi:voltage-gated potassium channel Kch